MAEYKTLSDVGEKGFIRGLLTQLKPHRTFINGFGNDASVIDIGLDRECLILKIDRAAKPIAADQGWSDFRLWGRIAVTSNCSDILAGGGSPKAMMISLVLPGDYPVARAEEIVLGCAEACAEHEIAFAGGDTKEGQTPQVVGCCAGTVSRDRILNRDTGRPGDAIVIAGQLGGFVGSFLQLRYPDQAKGSLLGTSMLKDYITHPEARWVEADVVNQGGFAHGAMDLSDGLLDVLQTFGGKQHGVLIDLPALPFHPFAAHASDVFRIPLFNFAFGVGDWGIAYLIPAERVAPAREAARRAGGSLTPIGVVTGAPGVRARDDQGLTYEVKGIVNEHFRVRMEDARDYIDRIRTDTTLRRVAEKQLRD